MIVLTEEEKFAARTITSYDLEIWTAGGKEFLKEEIFPDGEYTPKQQLRELERMRRVESIARYLKVGKFFDWKEEAKLRRYLSRVLGQGKYKYAYDAYPGGDGYSVILSMIWLKRADRL